MRGPLLAARLSLEHAISLTLTAISHSHFGHLIADIASAVWSTGEIYIMPIILSDNPPYTTLFVSNSSHYDYNQTKLTYLFNMMLSGAILLYLAALTSIAVGTAPTRGPNDPMPVLLSHKDKPKPVNKANLNPPVLDVSEYLVKELKNQTVNVVRMWNDSKINYECKKIFTKESYKVEDIEMFEVKYEDVSDQSQQHSQISVHYCSPPRPS